MTISAILHPLSSILGSSSTLAYTPFLTPLPIWDWWYLLLLPLSAAVAVIYKSIKCESMRDVPRQALSITLWIVLGMMAAAALLAGIQKGIQTLLEW